MTSRQRLAVGGEEEAGTPTDEIDDPGRLSILAVCHQRQDDNHCYAHEACAHRMRMSYAQVPMSENTALDAGAADELAVSVSAERRGAKWIAHSAETSEARHCGGWASIIDLGSRSWLGKRPFANG